jgi:hypothetical protein
LEPIDLDLSAYSMAIVHPGITISTAEAFSDLHLNLKTSGPSPEPDPAPAARAP